MGHAYPRFILFDSKHQTYFWMRGGWPLSVSMTEMKVGDIVLWKERDAYRVLDRYMDDKFMRVLELKTD
jgi:hypothetical protein